MDLFCIFFRRFRVETYRKHRLVCCFLFPRLLFDHPIHQNGFERTIDFFSFLRFFSLDLFFCLPPRLCRFLGFFFFLVVVLSKVGSVIGFISLNRLLLREIVFFSFFFFFLFFFLVKAILVLSIRGPWISSIVLKWMDKEWIVLVLEMILLIVCKKGTLSP